MAMHRGQQLQQLPVVSAPPGRASRPARRRGRRASPGAEAVAESFHNWATVVRKLSRLTIRSASPTNSKSVALFAALEHLAFDAVVGAVAVGHVFVGRAEQVVFVVRLPSVFSATLPACRVVAERLGGHLEAGHLPILLGVGFEVVEELPRQRPALRGRHAASRRGRPVAAAGGRRLQLAARGRRRSRRLVACQRSSIHSSARSWNE